MTETASPLTPEQQGEIKAANERLASFLGAAKVAAFNGWTLAFFAGVSIFSGLFSPSGLVVGVALGAIARNELVGRRRLRALEPEALDLLWKNQIGLMVVISLYCLWSIYRTTAAPDPNMAELTELLGGDTGDLIQSITVTAYTAVIGATVIFQGLNARYYHLRIERVREHLELTPSWVLDLQRATTDS